MVLFGLTTDKTQQVLDFVAKTNERMSESNLLKNPFHGSINTIDQDTKILHIVDMQPIYPNFTIFGWLMALTIFVLSGFTWNWWLLPGLLLGLLSIFWMTPFYQFMYKKGLKKAGYTGKYANTKQSEIIKLLCEARGENGTARSSRDIEGVKEGKQ